MKCYANSKPTFTSVLESPLSLNINEDFTWPLRFDDFDGDTVTVTVDVKLSTTAVAGFSIIQTSVPDQYTHVLYFNKNAFTRVLAKSASETYDVVISYSDSVHSGSPSTYTTTIEVTNLNRAPRLKSSVSLATKYWTIGGFADLVTKPQFLLSDFEDQDGDTITFSACNVYSGQSGTTATTYLSVDDTTAS